MEQALRLVDAQRLRRQPGQSGELPDRNEFVHERHRGLCPRGRVKEDRSSQPPTIVAASAVRWSFVQGGPNRRPRTLQDLVCPLTQHADRLTDDFLRVVEVDFPVASVRELGQHLAIHDGVGAGFIGRAPLDGDVGGEVQWPGSERDRDDWRGQRWLRVRRAQLTSPERPTLAPSRPAQPWRGHRDDGSRSESVQPSSPVRPARSAGGPRPRGQPTPSRRRPTRNDRQCPHACRSLSREGVRPPAAGRLIRWRSRSMEFSHSPS